MRVRRLHLFEWEDQPWLPRVLRDYMTDHLRLAFAADARGVGARAMAERLAALLRRTGDTRLVDLCSGAGGPLPDVVRCLRDEHGIPATAVLTDLHPNVAALAGVAESSGGAITPRFEPVDALAVPAELDGVRTMFTALHHLPPAAVRRLLAGAVAARRPIAVFEPLVRSALLAGVAGVLAVLRGLVMTPRTAHLGAFRLALTYLLPVGPLLLGWDGAVSVLRTYTADELRAFAAQVARPDYAFEVGTLPSGNPVPITYLIGAPRA